MFIRPKEDWIGAGIVGVIAFILICALTGKARAESIPEALAVKALVGEAGGQGDAELYAHACALRNRGSLQGVYGLRATGARMRSRRAQERARTAWRMASSGKDVTKGATHWLSEYDLAHSRPELIAWRLKAVGQVKVGQTTFYKMRRAK